MNDLKELGKLMKEHPVMITGSPYQNRRTGTTDTAELQAAWGEE